MLDLKTETVTVFKKTATETFSGHWPFLPEHPSAPSPDYSTIFSEQSKEVTRDTPQKAPVTNSLKRG